MPGHEDLIESLMFDGKTTGPEAAVKVLAAERKIKETSLENLHNGAAAPVDHSTPPDVEILSDDDDDPDGEFDETLATEKFNKSKSLKKEFGDLESYLAYSRAMADGRVKVLKNKK
jgi:hypothetical protein